MQKRTIDTINEAINILAYNEWSEPHPKDKGTIKSLAESLYPWTEKQAYLALSIVKRYATKLESNGLEIRSQIKNPKFEKPFRIINSQKIIELGQDQNGDPAIIMKFPYNEKIVKLIRCCKDYKGLPGGYFLFDGETKIWTVKKTDVTTYYMTMIAVRYNFAFGTEKFLDEFNDIKNEKIKFKKTSANIVDNNIVFSNASESLIDYWNKNLKHKKLLIQLDKLKNLGVPQKKLRVKAYSEIGKRIAHNNNTSLWIDKKSFNKDEIIIGLQELDCFPILMPVSGDIVESRDNILDTVNWFKTFERHGIQEQDISWGFELREPKMLKDKTDEERSGWAALNENLDQPTFEMAYDLYQHSKHFRGIEKNTKVYLVRNKIPRTMMRTDIEFKCSIVAIGGGYYATGGETIKRLLDNLPKKLYYSEAEPMSHEWHSRTIIKL